MMRLTIPKLRTWHLLGIVAASAAFFSVMQFRWTVEDDGYALIRRLRSSDAAERTKAANGLIFIRPIQRRAISPLTEMLFDVDPRARAEAARALLHIAGGGRYDPPGDEAELRPVKAALASVLNDSDPTARVAIAGSLGFLGTEPETIVPTLVELARNPDAKIRAETLAIFGPYLRRSEPALTALFGSLNDPDPLVRRRAVETLGNGATYPDIAPAPVLGRIKAALVKAADDQAPAFRAEVLVALGRISARTTTEIPRLIQGLTDPDVHARRGAAAYLTWRNPRKRSPEVVPALERALSDPDPLVRQYSASTLGSIGFHAEAALPSLRTLINDPEEGTRISVDAAIATIETDARNFRSTTLPQAIADLTHADSSVRALAASRIEEYGPKGSDAIPPLVVCLGDREAEVRRAAARALGQLGPGAAVATPTLANLADSDPDENVRLAAKLARSILLQSDPASPSPSP